MPRKTKGKCMFPQCPAVEITTRELCPAHYQALRHRIHSGKLSWVEAERIGLCGKSKKVAPEDIDAAIEKMREEYGRKEPKTW